LIQIDLVGELIQQSESIEFPSSSICLGICKASASSVCLLVPKLAQVTLYYMFKQFTIILIHIFT